MLLYDLGRLPASRPVNSRNFLFNKLLKTFSMTRQEMDLGDAVAEHLQNSHQVIEDEKLTSYIRRIGERLTKHLPPTNLRFQFFLFDINDVNAFTLPGGRILFRESWSLLPRMKMNWRE